MGTHGWRGLLPANHFFKFSSLSRERLFQDGFHDFESIIPCGPAMALKPAGTRRRFYFTVTFTFQLISWGGGSLSGGILDKPCSQVLEVKRV